MKINNFNKYFALPLVAVTALVSAYALVSHDKQCYGQCFVDVNAQMNAIGFKQMVAPVDVIKADQNSKYKLKDVKVPRVFVVDYKGNYSIENSEVFRNNLEKVFATTDRRGDILLLNIDSTGGDASACANDYAMVMEAKEYLLMNVVAVVDNNALSCGYLLASSADKLLVNPGANIGGIGAAATIISNPVHTNIKKSGGQVDVFASTNEKRLFNGGEIKDDNDRKIFQKFVDDGASYFYSKVIKGRGNSLKPENHKEAFSAMIFNGEKALSLGLADGLSNYRLELRKYHISGKRIVKIETVKRTQP